MKGILQNQHCFYKIRYISKPKVTYSTTIAPQTGKWAPLHQFYVATRNYSRDRCTFNCKGASPAPAAGHDLTLHKCRAWPNAPWLQICATPIPASFPRSPKFVVLTRRLKHTWGDQNWKKAPTSISTPETWNSAVSPRLKPEAQLSIKNCGYFYDTARRSKKLVTEKLWNWRNALQY